MSERHSKSKIQVACQLLAGGCTGLMVCSGGHAAELINNDSYSLRADTTLQYTLGVRTAKPSPGMLSNPNFDDGDGAFKRGDLTTNRVDVTEEIDLLFKDAYRSGLRFSANAWYTTYTTRSTSRYRPPPTTHSALPTTSSRRLRAVRPGET